MRKFFRLTNFFATSAPTESEQPARRHDREQERPTARLQGVLRSGEGGQVERHVESFGIMGCLRVERTGEGDTDKSVFDLTIQISVLLYQGVPGITNLVDFRESRAAPPPTRR